MNRDPHSADLWDGVAAQYDSMRPDQSLVDPDIRRHWQQLYAKLLPRRSCTILDAGCGTGSLTLALAESGHTVFGIDFSPQMIAQAQTKLSASALDATFAVQDAVRPDLPPQTFDAVTCRQVLWALPDRKAALRNWAALLKSDGLMIFIEGLFASGNGMAETEILAALPGNMEHVETRDLSADGKLWGAPLKDQRYLLIAQLRSAV